MAKTCDRCDAIIEWNDEKKQFEDTLFPGEKHNHQKFTEAAATRGEQSQEQKTEQVGKECYTCKANGHPNVKIFFNDKKKSPAGKMIPLDNPHQVNGAWKTHTHREKGKSADQAQQEADELSDYEPPEMGPEQSYSDEEIKALLGEFLNKGSELVSRMTEITPKIETILGYLMNRAVSRASDK
jgi:hypothetical protein